MTHRLSVYQIVWVMISNLKSAKFIVVDNHYTITVNPTNSEVLYQENIPIVENLHKILLECQCIHASFPAI